MPIKIPELLAPAGNLEKLVTAIHYGADAIYLAGKQYGLRARAGNFTEKEMAEGIAFAHGAGAKVYVTVNIFAHNQDFIGLAEYLHEIAGLGVDGVIIADPGVLAVARREVPQLPVHLSTQANVTNMESARFWQEQGVVRLNLARELSLKEICGVRAGVDCELEIFIHGALCISYSGRCMLSSYLTGRDANHGACAHPCRFNYALMEEKRPGEYYPVEEDERGTYIFNSRDLCLLEMLPQLVAAGADSLKIEGRMKSIFYVGGVVRAYRAALDYLAALPESAWDLPELIKMPGYLMEEVSSLGTRGTTENFIKGRPGSSEMIYDSSRMEQVYEPIAVVRKAGEQPFVEMRNTVFPGEEIEYMGRAFAERQVVKLVALRNEEGEGMEKANPGNRLFLELEHPVVVEPLGIFRRNRDV